MKQSKMVTKKELKKVMAKDKVEDKKMIDAKMQHHINQMHKGLKHAQKHANHLQRAQKRK